MKYSESINKIIESILQFGAISYVFGFSTVYFHTIRIGIPIIETLKPINVIVGIPLAIVFFFLIWFQKYLIDKYRITKDKLNKTREEIIEIQKESGQRTDEEVISKMLDTYLLLLNVLPFSRISSWIFSKMKNKLYDYFVFIKKIVTRKKDFPQEQKNKTFIYCSMLIQWIRGYILIDGFFNNIIIAILILIACWFYIFRLYPEIPQQIGGGEPSQVILILDTSFIDANMKEVKSLFPTYYPNSKPDLSLETKKIDLLYTTSDMYFVRTPNGTPLSINKDFIEGIIWNP